jgi:Lhr-like helicase
MTVDGEAYRSHFRRLTRRLPYDYQMRVAMEIFSGRNVVVRAPTGAGKTWAVSAPFFFEGWEPDERPRAASWPLRAF